ncbi:hypothetical protein [Rhodococcus sp. 24CO]|uniref:hypothetical protein n=1 Tax=Rhodococcus sp. 24CO TaxID=3117460 RepID=UPI003D354773
MIETGVDVMEGGSLSFQEVGVDFVRYPPAFELLNWDADQHLLLIRTGTEMGAVHFRSEEYEAEPPFEKTGWEEVQEVSASFDTAIVRMLDFETDYQDFPDESLISRPGGYRVRLYAVGRESGVECQELDDDLVERYFLQLWPDPDVRPATPVRRIGA